MQRGPYPGSQNSAGRCVLGCRIAGLGFPGRMQEGTARRLALQSWGCEEGSGADVCKAV